MVNIFLCDDNPVQLRHVRDFIEDYTKDTQPCIFDFSAPDDLLVSLNEHGADIAVLDIRLGRSNGIDLQKPFMSGAPAAKLFFLLPIPSTHPRSISPIIHGSF